MSAIIMKGENLQVFENNKFYDYVVKIWKTIIFRFRINRNFLSVY